MSVSENPQVDRGGPKPTEYDGYADGQAISPGQLLEVTSADGDQGYSPHSTAAGPCEVMVALEEVYHGDRTTDTHPLDDDYPAGEYVRAANFASGALVGLRLPDATALTEGTMVVSDGAGNIRAYDSAGGDPVGAVIGEVHGGDFDSGAGDILATVRLY